MLAELAGLFENDVRAVYANGGLAGVREIVRSPYLYVPHDAVVPGAIRFGDWAAIRGVAR